jgi:predicted amidohydrolase YtcJ
MRSGRPAEPLRLDRLIRARAIHSMTGQVYRSIGLYGSDIAAVSADPHGLDALAGRATVVVEAGDLTMLPAFADSHEHLIEASRTRCWFRWTRRGRWRSSPACSQKRARRPGRERGS